MRVVVDVLREVEATIVIRPMTTTAPTMIHSHGTVVVDVLDVTLVEVSPLVPDVPVVVLGLVPALGAVTDEFPLDEPGLVVVVVLDVPLVPVDCAKLATGAMLRKTTRSRTLRRMIVRISFPLVGSLFDVRLLAQETERENT
jgi:hypothetical protein